MARVGLRPGRPRTGGAHAASAPSSDSASRVAAALLSLLVVAVLGTLVWASGRGFDLTDEGFVLLSYSDPAATPADFSQFAVLVDLLLGPLEPGIAGYRLLRLVSLAGAAAVLGWTFHGFCRARLPGLARGLPGRGAVTLFVTLTGLLGYSWLPHTLSYNDVNTVLVHLEATLVLRLGLRPEPRLSRRDVAAGVALGALAAAHLFVKWPAAVAVLSLGIVTLIGLGVRRAILVALLVLGGAGAAAAVITTEGLGGPFSLGDLASATRTTSGGETHDPSELLSRYVLLLVEVTRGVITEAWWRIVVLAVLLGGAVRLCARFGVRSLPVRAAWVVVGAAGLVLLWEAGRFAGAGDGYFVRGRQQELFVSLLLALALAAGLGRGRGTGDRGVRAVSVLFFTALPFAAAFGTASPLALHAYTAAGGLGCLMLLAVGSAGRIGERLDVPSLHLVAPLVLGVIFAGQIIHGTVIAPYRLPTSLLEQSVPVQDVPRLQGVRVDRESAEFFSRLQRAVREETSYRQGEPILGLSHMPGLVYLLGGQAPGPKWVDYPLPGRQQRTCDQLAASRADAARTDLVLVNSQISSEMQACLPELLPGWPGDFDEQAAVENSYSEIMPLYLPEVLVISRD